MTSWNRRGVVITGAGNGIGKALATRLAAAGVRVVVNDLDAEAAHKVAEKIGGHAVPGDAASVDGVESLVRLSHEYLGHIDAWFGNAGVERGRSLDTSEDDWNRSYEVNVMAHVRAARLLGAALAGARLWPLRRHGIGSRPAHSARRAVVLGYQTRRDSFCRMAVRYLSPPRNRRSSSVPPGGPNPDARTHRRLAGPTQPRHRADARAGGRQCVGSARRRPLPHPPSSRRRALLRRTSHGHRPLARRHEQTPAQARRQRFMRRENSCLARLTATSHCFDG